MEVEILKFRPELQPYFKNLNVEWLEKYFVVEPHDLVQLNNAQSYIIDTGGEILFAKYNDEIIGTVAIKKVEEGKYELAKMAVTEKYKGIGAGKKLCAAAIETAKNLGASYLFLESNQSLTPALNIYKSLGFVEVPIGETPYERANYKAEIWF